MCDPIGQNGKSSKTKKNRIWQLVGESQGGLFQVFFRAQWLMSKQSDKVMLKPGLDWREGSCEWRWGSQLQGWKTEFICLCPLGGNHDSRLGGQSLSWDQEITSVGTIQDFSTGVPTLETYERLNARADGMWWWGKVRQMVDKIRHLQRQSRQMGAGVKLDKWLQGQGDTSKTACGLDRKHTLRLRGHKNNGPVQEDNWFYFKRCWKCFKIYI